MRTWSRSAGRTALPFLFATLSACGGGGGESSAPVSGAGPVSPPSSDISLSVVTPAAASPGGGSAVIDIIVVNAGTQSATGVVLSTLLGPGLTSGAISCSSTGSAVCPPTAGTTITIGTLPPSSSLQLRNALSIAAGKSGPIAGTATVSMTGGQANLTRSANFAVTAYSADVIVASTARADRVVHGTTSTYLVTVTNTGPDAATGLVINSSLDAGQQLGAMTCAASGGAACPSLLGESIAVPALPKDGVLTLTLPALVPSGSPGQVKVTASVQVPGDPQIGNNSSTASTRTTPPNSIRLVSDSGDYVGAGRSYAYLRTNSLIGITSNGRHLAVTVQGDELWNGDFEGPSSLARLEVGEFLGLMRYPFHNPVLGGLSWWGEGRGCNTLLGSFAVKRITYVADKLDEIDLDFVQYCEGGAAALLGQIHWSSSDVTQPPGPVNPPPPSLWVPPANATPATGNYVYLQSDSGDYIGLGGTYLYTPPGATFNVTSAGSSLSVAVAGAQVWSGRFQAMDRLGFLQPGYYGDLQRFPFHNPAKGGMDWSGEGRGCNRLTGWFAIDSISFDQGEMKSVELRFEQHCEGGMPALRGKMRWSK